MRGSSVIHCGIEPKYCGQKQIRCSSGICVTVSSNSDSLAADARLFFVAVVMGMSPSIKKRQRRWLAYAVIMSVRED